MYSVWCTGYSVSARLASRRWLGREPGRRPRPLGGSPDEYITAERGGGYCRLRSCCLELLDRELFALEDKLKQLKLTRASLMRVSNRIIPPSKRRGTARDSATRHDAGRRDAVQGSVLRHDARQQDNLMSSHVARVSTSSSECINPPYTQTNSNTSGGCRR